MDVIRRLMDAVRRKRPEKWSTNMWFLHHDNVPTHRSVLVEDFLTKYNVMSLEYPPHSSDLVPFDFYLFPRPKSAFKGRRFVMILR
jgi:hypothetical protein